MPTNEERREVAARMRYVVEHGAPEWGTIACCIADCLGADDYPLWENGDKLFDLLADLIEPETERTCEFDSQAFALRRCKRCGAFVSVDSVYDCFGCIPVRYCPNCGAKVIGGYGAKVVEE